VVSLAGTAYQGVEIALTPAGAPKTAQKAATDANGRFEFGRVPPGDFRLTVAATGFTAQTMAGTLHSGESLEAPRFVLAMGATASEVRVTATREEVAEEQVHIEEQQRVLGVIPNFYVAYDRNALPLSPRQKFELAWRSSIDPFTFIITGAFAGAEQAENTFSGYGQGTQGYAKRFGANYADNFTGTMIGGAILTSWWKQDPRYFYKGTGTFRERALYAIANAVICKGDNGHWQFNYSAFAGGLASGAISNIYYPASNRSGATLIFENLGIGTAESAAQNMVQEFVVRRFTPKAQSIPTSNP
jgi:hypothetical protein